MPAPPKRCSRCHLVYYCSLDCQKKHWSRHKPDCRDVNEMRCEVAGIGATLPPTQATNEDCAICLQDTIEDPIILDCRHAFCFTCLRDYAMVRRRTGTKLMCPLCREPYVEGAAVQRILLFMARAARKDITDEEREALLSQAQDDLSRALEADPNDMQVMFTKVELLLLQKDFDQAIQVIQSLMELDKKGRENSKILIEKLDRAKMAEEEGREEDADRIMDEIEQFHQEGHSFSRFKNGGLDLVLFMAEAQELAQDWEAAIETYKSISHETYEDFSRATPVQQRKLLMGISRCFYKVGNYVGAIAMGEGAIDMNRHFPGVYKYVALSYKEKGDRQMAKTMMNRAVLYETPWDDRNREEAYELFKDLASEDS